MTKEEIFKKLFDLYLRDLKLMTNLIYDWSGITINIRSSKYNEIQAIIDIFPQLLSYLFGDLSKIYKVEHNTGYVKLHSNEKPETDRESYIVYQFGQKEEYKLYFNLSINWEAIPLEYLYLDDEDLFYKDVQWDIIDRKYINHHKYRADSKKKMSITNLTKLIPFYFSSQGQIPELFRTVLDMLPVIDNSIRDLESDDVYIFPEFKTYQPDHKFSIFWNIFIIPNTIIVYHYKSKYFEDLEVYLPCISIGISTY